MNDILDYHPDTVVTETGFLDTYGAELMIAGEYASQNDYENALDVLETISFRRNLSPVQEADLENVITIYSLLEGKNSPYHFNSSLPDILTL